jgi:hypothetical protein
LSWLGGYAIENVSLTPVPDAPPVIQSQPCSESVPVGTQAEFTLSIAGAAPLSYQWQLNGTNLTETSGVNGTMSNLLTVANAGYQDLGGYDVVINVSLNLLTVSAPTPPTITSQPQPQIALLGSIANFSVVANGASPLNYQWQIGAINLTNDARVTGSSNALIITPVLPADAGPYSVVVTNVYGFVTSAVASLTVFLPAIAVAGAPGSSGLQFTLSAVPGYAYQLQTTTNLASAGWTNVGSAITATNASIGTIEAIGTDSQRFYRVVLSQ